MLKCFLKGIVRIVLFIPFVLIMGVLMFLSLVMIAGGWDVYEGDLADKFQDWANKIF